MGGTRDAYNVLALWGARQGRCKATDCGHSLQKEAPEEQLSAIEGIL